MLLRYIHHIYLFSYICYKPCIRNKKSELVHIIRTKKTLSKYHKFHNGTVMCKFTKIHSEIYSENKHCFFFVFPTEGIIMNVNRAVTQRQSDLRKTSRAYFITFFYVPTALNFLPLFTSLIAL